MKFLVDVCLSVRIANFLRSKGFQTNHLEESLLRRLPDDRIMAKAKREQSVIITADLDFGELLAISKDVKPSVIIFRTRSKSFATISSLLEKFLSQIEDELEKGAIVVFEDDGVRIHHLPV